jgi:hypothetical protein
MTTARTRITRTPRTIARTTRAADAAARVDPKPAPAVRGALSECVRAALRCATSAPFVASAARSHADAAEPAPCICG